jgi:hypothetical protein
LANILRRLTEERGASPLDALSLKELVLQAASPAELAPQAG